MTGDALTNVVLIAAVVICVDRYFHYATVHLLTTGRRVWERQREEPRGQIIHTPDRFGS